jgi:microcystin-dependent protein
MSDYFLGEIRNFAFGRVPQGWVACNGQSLPINQYTALFALIGTQFGGNGTTVFNVPDLRGRVPYGNAATLTTGTMGGSENVTLTLANLPPHTHGMFANATTTAQSAADIGNFLSVNTAGGSGQAPFPIYAPYTAASATPLAPSSITMAGGSAPHENRQPTLTTNFCISTVGIFPSRP